MTNILGKGVTRAAKEYNDKYHVNNFFLFQVHL